MNIRYINGRKFRFEPTIGELQELHRVPFVSSLVDVLAGSPQDVIDQAVAWERQNHEEKEDARIAAVQEHHDRIRKDGVEVGRAYGSRWYTTNRG